MRKNNLIRSMFVIMLVLLLATAAQTMAIDPGDYDISIDVHTDMVEEAASQGAASFLKVEGYEPWAVMVVNAGDPRGVDMVTVSFEDGVLRIEATDSNHTNHVTILMNKEFADLHLAEAESDLEIETSDAVNYEGLNEAHEIAADQAVYVFHIENFSTQWIEVSGRTPPSDFVPPVEDAKGYYDSAKNAAAHGAVTFLKVEGYEPWAAAVVNAGDPRGVDMVTVSFEDGVLRIEVTDNNHTNHVSILMNRAFADEHLADAEGDLEIETSDAVNYEGLDRSNASVGGGAVYVFHVENFSTQWIEVSAAEDIPHAGFILLLVAVAIPAVYYVFRKKE